MTMCKLNRIKVSENFFLDEFIDPKTYLELNDHGINEIDYRLFHIAQEVRNLYKAPLYINTWWDKFKELEDKKTYDEIVEIILKDNSIRKWSGLRTKFCTIGGKLSAHRKGLAIDLKGDGKKLYEIVKANAKKLYKLGLRRIEDKRITTTWLHADLWERNTKPNSIRVVDLTKSTETIYF